MPPDNRPEATASSIVVQRLHDDATVPTRATEGSAGYDLAAYLRDRTVRCSDGVRQWEAPVAADATLSIAPGMTVLVPLGFKAQLPHGYEAQIRPRSGTSFKKGLQLPNAPGTIDADFPDEWMVLLRNPNAHAVTVAHGERIAQMVLHRFEVLPFVEGEVGRSTSRTGGFGSTGH